MMMHSPQILAVDDDATIRNVVQALFRAEGYRVATAANGSEALPLLNQIEPALIILDLEMPGLSGCDVARAARAGGCRAPILLMSARRDLRQRAAEIGADAYLAKPFDLDDLLTTVARLAGPPTPISTASPIEEAMAERSGGWLVALGVLTYH
jgi:DNA-binding response OmpR family regulator